MSQAALRQQLLQLTQVLSFSFGPVTGDGDVKYEKTSMRKL